MHTRRRWILAAALAFPLVSTLACDDDDDTGPDGAARVEAILDGSGGTVVVTEGDGAGPVTDATVTLNGTAATPGGAAGEYDIVLPAPVAAGGTMTLEVSNAEFAIEGTGTVPEAPVITAPANAATFLPTESIDVTWTSPSDPDGFVVVAEGATTEAFPVAGGGAAREHTIPAGTLANGSWTIRVRAANLGGFVGDTEAGSDMVINAEAAVTSTITVGTPLLRIEGDPMSRVDQSIRLTLGGAPVNGATVTVNGEAAFQDVPGALYMVALSAPPAVGGQLDLDVTVGADVYQGLGNVPEPPVITAPADASVFTAADAIEVTWTAATDPDRFVVRVFGSGPEFSDTEVAGNLRALTIPGGTFTAGTYNVFVYTAEDGEFTGAAVDGASRMNILNAPPVGPVITINP